MNELDLAYLSIDTLKIRLNTLESEIAELKRQLNSCRSDDAEPLGGYGSSHIARNEACGVDD